jgi:hypothetical protein
MSREVELKADVSEKSLKQMLERFKAEAWNALINASAISVDEAAKIAEEEARKVVDEYPYMDDLTGNLPTVSRTETVYKGDTCEAEVRLNGEDAVFFEFGAGQYYNVPVGSSEHPRATETGFTIGSYPGQTHAGDDYWYLPKEAKKRSGKDYTHGTKAVMPLHTAKMAVVNKLKGNE